MKIIKPYNDEKMTFDEISKKYVLTKEYITEQFGDPYDDDKVLEKRAKKNSRVVYNYIYKAGNAKNKPIVDLILNETQNGRDFMLELLSSQMEADIENGVNSLGDLPAINTKGQVLDEQAMSKRILTQNTLDILDQATGRLGLNVIYNGPFPPLVWAELKGYLK